MTERRPSASLLPLETLLTGAWLALIVALPVALALMRQQLDVRTADKIGHLLRHRAGVAEGLLGLFIVLLHLRRQARGVALLLPFAALTLAFVSALFIAPIASEVASALARGAADKRSHADVLANADAWIALLKVLVLFGLFATALPRGGARR